MQIERKTIDRTALIAAVICGLIGFIFGMVFTEKNHATDNPEFNEWKQLYKAKKDDLRAHDFKLELERINRPDFGRPGPICLLEDYLEYDPRLSELRQQRPSMTIRPPVWKFLLGALIGSTCFSVAAYVSTWSFFRLATNVLRVLRKSS